MKEDFEIFDLPETASYGEVKDARIKLLKKFHPDLYIGNKDFAKLRTVEINQAFDALSRHFQDKNSENVQEKSTIKRENSTFKKENSTIKKEKPVKVLKKPEEIDETESPSQKINQKIRNGNIGKKTLDILIYILIALFVCLIFVMLFS